MPTMSQLAVRAYGGDFYATDPEVESLLSPCGMQERRGCHRSRVPIQRQPCSAVEFLSRHLTEKMCCVHQLTLLDNTILVSHIGYVIKGQYQVRYRETVENVAVYFKEESSES